MNAFARHARSGRTSLEGVRFPETSDRSPNPRTVRRECFLKRLGREGHCNLGSSAILGKKMSGRRCGQGRLRWRDLQLDSPF
eukprot:735593-Pyramimonas_sp.AAC.1